MTKISNYEIHFHQLQREYVVAEMRRIIYPLDIDRRYYDTLMGWKKDKVLKLMEDHPEELQTSIFNDTFFHHKLKKEFYNGYGYPNFEYPNSNSQDFVFSDYVYFYSFDVDLDFINDSGVFEGYHVQPKLKPKTKVCYYHERRLKIGYVLGMHLKKVVIYNYDKDSIDNVWSGYVFHKEFINNKINVFNKSLNTYELLDRSLVTRKNINWT